MSAILKANKAESVSKLALYPGKKIRLPDPDYTPPAGSTKGKKTSSSSVSLTRQSQAKSAEKALLKTPKMKKSRAPGFTWPYRGRVVRRYGLYDDVMNSGINIEGERGDIIRSSYEGYVEFVGELRGYGMVVIVRHNSDYDSVYAYVEKVRVKEGARVKKNEVLGVMGRSSESHMPELHFKICYRGKPVNPVLLLP